MIARDISCIDAGIYWVMCGKEECASGYFFGPCIRDHYVIHYVEKGEGIFRIKDKEYHICAGEIFFIPPWVSTYYEADKQNPWEYKWIGIKARNIKRIFGVAGLSAHNPVMKVEKEISHIIDIMIAEMENGDGIRPVMYAYDFLSQLIKNKNTESIYKPQGQIYAEAAVDLISKSVYKKITVGEIAEFVGVDRSYFMRIFKKYIGISPQQYIMDIKMQTACEYLSRTDYDITQIAQSVGYDDLFVFSHAFKNYTGKSPKNYREQKNEV